jgi:hypothetical protein
MAFPLMIKTITRMIGETDLRKDQKISNDRLCLVVGTSPKTGER